jgi:hypothetical protein
VALDMLQFRVRAVGVAVGVLAAGCNSILGLSGFSVTSDAGGAGPDARASCSDAGASGSCYACTPRTNAQFLNACDDAGCIPFDDKARIKGLPLDGSLPPVPDVADSGGP